MDHVRFGWDRQRCYFLLYHQRSTWELQTPVPLHGIRIQKIDLIGWVYEHQAVHSAQVQARVNITTVLDRQLPWNAIMLYDSQIPDQRVVRIEDVAWNHSEEYKLAPHGQCDCHQSPDYLCSLQRRSAEYSLVVGQYYYHVQSLDRWCSALYNKFRKPGAVYMKELIKPEEYEWVF